jgi:hypothetical protein
VIHFVHVPHPHVQQRLDRGAPTSSGVLATLIPARVNRWLAVKITAGVGTMYCAYAFAGLSLVSLPAAILSANPVTIVSWISQTFLQLVLLSIILVGQSVVAEAADARAKATFDDATAILAGQQAVHDHLTAQDAVIDEIRIHLRGTS